MHQGRAKGAGSSLLERRGLCGSTLLSVGQSPQPPLPHPNRPAGRAAPLNRRQMSPLSTDRCTMTAGMVHSAPAFPRQPFNYDYYLRTT